MHHETESNNIGSQRAHQSSLQGKGLFLRRDHPDPQEELPRSGLGEMQNGSLEEDEGQEVEVEKRAPSRLKEIVPGESDQREDNKEIERDIKPPGKEPQER